MRDHYVYVYIDPRNHEEFYYGKGKGSRKNAHLKAEPDTDKANRIAAIRKAGLEPLIRVVARGLTEEEALLVEKTLLHKLGKSLTNVSSGHYADKFRPHDTLHVELSGFDYKSGVYYFNIGQGEHRQWADCRKYGFISAGQGWKWAQAICRFNADDIFAAYLKRKGFVGIGQVVEKARPIREVKINGRPLVSLNLKCKNMDDNIDSDKKCEYVALVKWIKSLPEDEAKFERGLYTTANLRASLDNQPKTRSWLEDIFDVSFSALAR
jgi:hypothetical protein